MSTVPKALTLIACVGSFLVIMLPHLSPRDGGVSPVVFQAIHADQPPARQDDKGVIDIPAVPVSQIAGAHEHDADDLKGIHHVHTKDMLHLLPEEGGLELIPSVKPVYFFRRPGPARSLSRDAGAAPTTFSRTTSNGLRIACLQSGFMRRFEYCLNSCRDRKSQKYCQKPRPPKKQKKFEKRFGDVRARLFRSSDCDVFISTWHIRGFGRFNTNLYDTNLKVDGAHIRKLYADRLAALHIQNYTLYGLLWRFMQRFPRGFEQTRPTELHTEDKFVPSWEGKPESKLYLRMNDYSQAYKQWCVLRLVDTHAPTKYDLYYRLRPDLRTMALVTDFKWTSSRRESLYDAAVAGSETSFVSAVHPDPKAPYENAEVYGAKSTYPIGRVPTNAGYNASFVIQRYKLYYKVKNTIAHTVNANRIHVNNFDISDFAFLGPPPMIRNITIGVWAQCEKPVMANAPTIRPVAKDEKDPTRNKGDQLPMGTYAEFNLMTWRIIFDAGWEVDTGSRYLWVDRPNLRKVKPTNDSSAALVYEDDDDDKDQGKSARSSGKPDEADYDTATSGGPAAVPGSNPEDKED